MQKGIDVLQAAIDNKARWPAAAPMPQRGSSRLVAQPALQSLQEASATPRGPAEQMPAGRQL